MTGAGATEFSLGQPDVARSPELGGVCPPFFPFQKARPSRRVKRGGPAARASEQRRARFVRRQWPMSPGEGRALPSGGYPLPTLQAEGCGP